MFVSQNGKLGAAGRPTARGDHAQRSRSVAASSGLLCVGPASAATARASGHRRIMHQHQQPEAQQGRQTTFTLDPLRRLLSRSRYDQLIVSHFKNTATLYHEHRSYLYRQGSRGSSAQTTEHAGWRHGVGGRVHPIIVRETPAAALGPSATKTMSAASSNAADKPSSPKASPRRITSRDVSVSTRFLATARPAVLQGALIPPGAPPRSQVRQPLGRGTSPRWRIVARPQDP